MRLVDSHAHLDGLGAEALGAVLARAEAAGVGTIVTIGGRAEANERAVVLAAEFPGRIHAAVGFDRDQAAAAPDPAAVRALAGRPGVVAVGECGLDYHYHADTAAAQCELFRAMARTAAETGLPLVVHSREADADTLAILREHARAWKGDPGRLGVLHCFTGSGEFARAVLDMGLHISLSGIITFARADALREVARLVPDDRLLIETDTPYLAPVPVRGRPNEPAYLAHTAAALAQLRGVPIGKLAEQTARNAADLFGFRAEVMV